jgi:hypothetical protein
MRIIAIGIFRIVQFPQSFTAEYGRNDNPVIRNIAEMNKATQPKI